MPMPWATHSQQKQEEDHHTLNSLLTTDERAELTLLIAAIGEAMRVRADATFEAVEFVPGPGIQKQLESMVANPNLMKWIGSDADDKDEKGSGGKEKDEEKEKLKREKKEKEDAEEAEDERKRTAEALQKRREELSQPKLLELKASCLEFMADWQKEVLTRLGEVLNVTEKAAEGQTGSTPATVVQESTSKTDPVLASAAGSEKKPGEAGAEKTVPIVTDAPPKAELIAPQTPIVAPSSAQVEQKTPSAPVVEKKPVDEDTKAEDIDAALVKLYPPLKTELRKLPQEKRLLLLHAILLMLLSLEHYLAHSRVLLLYLTSSLGLPLDSLIQDETKVAQGLLNAAKEMKADSEVEKQSHENKVARRWKVGIASVAGAAIIGITGGLAAPLVAAGIGTIMGGIGLGATTAAGLLGTLAESGIIIGSLFGAYGGRMTGKMVDEYAREVEDFAFLPLHAAAKKRSLKQVMHDNTAEDRRLRVTIGVSGWMTDKEGIIRPWRVLGQDMEVFALRWELEALQKLGKSMTDAVKSAVWGMAKKQIIARTIFATLMSAMWPMSLLKISKIVDNPFSVTKSRSEKAGRVLADALINRVQGERPVTLVGYSLGARLIFFCLLELAERKAFGLIESVVLIGSPCPSDAATWTAIRSVVSGRVINVFSENDYILAFLYRTSSIQFGVAGLKEVEGVSGIENVDVSEIVSGHLRYEHMVGTILEKIGFENLDPDEIMKEEETLALLGEEDGAEKKIDG